MGEAGRDMDPFGLSCKFRVECVKYRASSVDDDDDDDDDDGDVDDNKICTQRTCLVLKRCGRESGRWKNVRLALSRRLVRRLVCTLAEVR